MSAPRRRGLGDVLHYFIPEDEQRAARERARPQATAPGFRWGLLADPSRPLDRSLAVDVASALASLSGDLEVIAPFPATGRALRWHAVEIPPNPTEAEAVRQLAEAIESADPSHLLVVVPPRWARPLLSCLRPESLRALLVPVDAAPWGLREGLQRLRHAASSAAGIRVGVFLVGQDAPGAGASSLQQLERAAKRQLGIPIDGFGLVVRDAASYRALLEEVPVVELDPEASSARSVEQLARRIFEARA